MRILHTMLRVGNLDTSLSFYQEVLGMKLLRRKDYPEGRFTLAFVGYGSEDETAVLELTHNWDTASYDLGNASWKTRTATKSNSSKNTAAKINTIGKKAT